MRARVPVAVAAALLLGACGAGDADSGGNSPSPTAPTTPQKTPAGPALAGTPANSDLSDFICEGGSDGEWTAHGVLSSPGGRSDYEVTVAVAPEGTRRSKARRKIVSDVTRKPTSFRVGHIPGDGDGGTCRIQVLRLH